MWKASPKTFQLEQRAEEVRSGCSLSWSGSWRLQRDAGHEEDSRGADAPALCQQDFNCDTNILCRLMEKRRCCHSPYLKNEDPQTKVGRQLAELQREMEDTRRTHEEQMHQLYAKVKVAVARKDSAIQALTREAAKHQEKMAVLEQKLQQQRKDFLKHK
ncbi:unnamed protein product [Plutella xylostella]|uniref:(diamondback moth) hypothetical protein n=1 Tax=Plutella xylostella TaxID=51655 RepID=A0A8S4DPM5_PLUXY|nr:unnamed protein product [Plutella xylostella]